MRESIILGAVGDISFSRQVGQDMLEHGADWVFAEIKPYLDQADVLFGNMESVMIPPDFPEAELDARGLVSRFHGCVECAKALKDAGFDFLNMASNHVLDGGSIGLDYTREVLTTVGIAVAGVGYSQPEAREMIILEKEGIRFGFLCYAEDNNYCLGHTNPGPAYFTVESVLADIARYRISVDILVVSIHADIEFMPTPSTSRREESRLIARAGADLILQHHPHVPQGIEIVDGCLIAYSLGNFVFDAHTSEYMKDNGPHTAQSFLLLAEVGKNGVKGFERIPFNICEPPNQRPIPMQGVERKKALDYLSRLDELVLNDDFVFETWRDVARKHLEIYLSRAGKLGLDQVIDELAGRLFLVAENRRWLEEILIMSRENWKKLHQETFPYCRPNSRV
jgi:poly-gamma-glutamate synthesis protein (capsule biosynthesis protein)